MRMRSKPCIYPNLQTWMQKNGKNYADLARATGLSFQTVTRTLSGENATKRSVDLILELTGFAYEVAFCQQPKSVERGDVNMDFVCKSLAHYKICEWLAGHGEELARVEAVDLSTLRITGNLGQTMTVKWDFETDVPEIVEGGIAT